MCQGVNGQTADRCRKRKGSACPYNTSRQTRGMSSWREIRGAQTGGSERPDQGNGQTGGTAKKSRPKTAGPDADRLRTGQTEARMGART